MYKLMDEVDRRGSKRKPILSMDWKVNAKGNRNMEE
jgi:hypothetical protein